MAGLPPRLGARSALRDFLGSEAAGGILLMAAAALALIVANGPFADAYHHIPPDPRLRGRLPACSLFRHASLPSTSVIARYRTPNQLA